VATVSSGLALKPAATVFSSLSLKLVAMVSPDLSLKLAIGFLFEPQNQGAGGFPGLCLKTDSYGFGDLGRKITAAVSWFGSQNQAGFGCWLHQKTDGGRSTRDARRDLAACLAWKQVWLEFPSLA
jgi:hypothetical protein